MSATIPLVALGVNAAGQFVQGMSSAAAASQAAGAAAAEGEAAAAQQQRQAARHLGTLRARQGASGLAADAGSGADMADDVAQEGMLEALTARYQGQRQAAAYRTQARQARFGAVAGLLSHALQGPQYSGWERPGLFETKASAADPKTAAG